MVARGGLSGTGGLVTFLSVSLSFLLLAAHAQTPPPPSQGSPQPRAITGFVSTYEVMRTVRSAGFDPLAPPLREGTVYVLRATDFRGILMRVVIDARTGTIRDVNRIVPAAPSQLGMASPYDAPLSYGSPYGPPPYGPPPGFDGPGIASPASAPPLPQPGSAAAHPAMMPPASHPIVTGLPGSPPLPRPRPAALASQNFAGGNPTNAAPKTGAKTSASAGTSIGGPVRANAAAPDAKPDIKSDAAPAAPAPPPAASAAPIQAPTALPLND
jgi:hypothetical protein